MDVGQFGAGMIPGLGPGLSQAIGTGRKAFGLGSYAVNTNDLINGGGGNTVQAPHFGEVSDTGATILSNREYIGNVYAPSSEGFTIQQYPLNPGMAQTFNWLSQIAANYDSYEFGQLIFTFKSTVSNFTTQNGVVGQIIMTTQYNPAAEPFEDKMGMMSYHGAVASKTSQNIMAGVECDPSKMAGTAQKFVRYQDLAGTQDIKEYDLGRLSVAVVDVPDELQEQCIGELWVSYTVKLQTPKLVTGRALAIQQDLYGIYNNESQFDADQPTIAPLVTGTAGCEIWGMNNRIIIEAPQNSIKCLVEQMGTGTPLTEFTFIDSDVSLPPTGSHPSMRFMRIVFPAQYNGNVTIRYNATCGAADRPTWVSFFMGCSGNIRPIEDIFVGTKDGTGVVDINNSQSGVAIGKLAFTPGGGSTHERSELPFGVSCRCKASNRRCEQHHLDRDLRHISEWHQQNFQRSAEH